MHSRRDFLKTSSLLAWGLSVPGFLGRTALATPIAGKAGAKDSILVVVQLTGGNDGLNTVVPYRDARYYALRPKLAIARDQAIALDDRAGLHPALAPLRTFA